jgi:protein gp37
MNNVKKSIGWCDWTINPVKGLCPVGCSYCYASRMYGRNCNEVFRDKSIRLDQFVFKDIGKSKPGDKIFVGSTIDLFHPKVSMWTEDIITICSNWPDRTFIFLTKCPQYLPKEWPDNCWVGVSVCNDKMLDIAVDKLEDIQAKVKIISFEPLLEHLTLSLEYTFYYSGVSWAIIGCQTPYSPKTAPRKVWIEEIIEAADKANIPVFLKDNLFSLFNKDCDNIPIWANCHDTGYLKQQFPAPEVL